MGRKPPRRRPANLLGRVPEEPCWKVRYRSDPDAQRALAIIAEQREREACDGKRETRAYECPRCGWHHLTAQALRPPRAPAAYDAQAHPEPNASTDRDARSA